MVSLRHTFLSICLAWSTPAPESAFDLEFLPGRWIPSVLMNGDSAGNVAIGEFPPILRFANGHPTTMPSGAHGVRCWFRKTDSYLASIRGTAVLNT
jgi:hypothetical protein